MANMPSTTNDTSRRFMMQSPCWMARMTRMRDMRGVWTSKRPVAFCWRRTIPRRICRSRLPRQSSAVAKTRGMCACPQAWRCPLRLPRRRPSRRGGKTRARYARRMCKPGEGHPGCAAPARPAPARAELQAHEGESLAAAVAGCFSVPRRPARKARCRAHVPGRPHGCVRFAWPDTAQHPPLRSTPARVRRGAAPCTRRQH